MNCVAQRVQQRAPIARNRLRKLPDIGLRNDDVAGEGAAGVHAQNLHVLADVRLADAALQALAAGHVHLRAHKVAFLDRGHAGSHAGRRAGELMARNQRRLDAPLRPRIPVEDVQVRAAHAGRQNADQHFAGAGHRHGHFTQFDAGRGMCFNNRFHSIRHIGQSSSIQQTYQSTNCGSSRARGLVEKRAEEQLGREGKSVLPRSGLRAHGDELARP